MSHLQAKKNEKVKLPMAFERHDTNLELPLKKGGLKVSLIGKITTISCQIDLGAIEPISHSLDFQTIVPHGRTFYAAQRFNQFNFGHHKKWVIDVDKSFTAHFMYVITKEEKKPVSHSILTIVSDSEV